MSGKPGVFEVSHEDMRQFERFESELKKLKGMTLQQREQAFREIFEKELMPICNAKGHDYSGTEDAFSNLRDFGWEGVVVRLGDKYHRLKNFCRQGELKVKDEAVEDTFKDMIIYAFIGLVLWRTK